MDRRIRLTASPRRGRPNRVARLALFLVFLAVAPHCGVAAESESKLVVAASIFPIYDWVREVGGEYVEVSLLLPARMSEHAFEPSPSAVKVLKRARLLFRNGLGLDEWAAKMVVASGNPQLEVVTLTEGLPALPIPIRFGGGHQEPTGTRSDDKEGSVPAEGTESAGPDPHMWLDPVLAQSMVVRIAAELKRVDPAHGEAYEESARDYVEELKRLDAEIRAAVAPLAERRVIAYHDAYTYLFPRYGLELIAVIEEFPGKAPSPKHIRRVMEAVRGLKRPVIFAEPQLSDKAARVLASETGARVSILDPLGLPGDPERGSYLELMRFNLRALVEALGEEGQP